MGEVTNISWTSHTFNPWMGCTKVSAGCDHCYAETLVAGRMGKDVWGHGKERQRTSVQNWKQPVKWNAAAEKSGVRHKVFCASLADVFDTEIPVEWLRDVLDLIRVTPMLDWQLLTKRPAAIRSRINDVRYEGLNRPNSRAEHDTGYMALAWLHGNPPRNVWLGTSVENQQTADARIPALLKVPAAVHWLSMEPLIEIVQLDYCTFCGWFGIGDHDCEDTGHTIDWVVVGGESGAGARPMHPDWARSLRDQCATSGVPFFMKQLGGSRDKRHDIELFPVDLQIREFPNANGCREIKDGLFG